MTDEFQQCFDNMIALRKISIMRDVADDIHTFVNSRGISPEKAEKIRRILEE